MPVGTVVIIIFGMMLGVGAIAILAEHFQNIAKIKADAQAKAGRDVMGALESLRQELAHIRETSTNYDLSFDSALQRLESRMAHLEQRMNQANKPDQSALTGR